MHDCASTENRIVELLFGELDESERPGLAGEITECAQCACVHSSVSAALAGLDEVIASQMPDESYWPEYEATLRARLELEHAPKRSGRVLPGEAGLKVRRPLVAYLVAAGLLLSFGLGLWLYSRDGSSEKTANRDGSKQERSKPQVSEPANQQPSVPHVAHERKNDNTVRKARAEKKRAEALSQRAGITNPAAERAPLEVRIAEHVESIEMLLRSFRNARAVGGESAPDVSFERALARKVIGQNNRLRHEAIVKGDLSVEYLLGSAEPFLLDIANLPENPSEDQTQTIRRLLKENGIISELRLYSVAIRPTYNP